MGDLIDSVNEKIAWQVQQTRDAERTKRDFVIIFVKDPKKKQPSRRTIKNTTLSGCIDELEALGVNLRTGQWARGYWDDELRQPVVKASDGEMEKKLDTLLRRQHKMKVAKQ